MRKKVLLISLVPISIVTVLVIGVFIFPLLITLNENLNPSVTILKTGRFVILDESHWGNGTVQLVEKSDGSRAIYFIDIEIATGPDLYVWLDAANVELGQENTVEIYISNDGSETVDNVEYTF